jgi:hypothetical protein
MGSAGGQGYGLLLPFDSDTPEFRRGAEIGMLWTRLEYEPYVTASIHADNAEMVIRVAEARGLPFTAQEAGPDWLHVTIGHAP